MQINLPLELKPFVEQEFATGRYASRKEILVQALRWLSEERRAAVAGIREGLDDVAARRTQTLQDAFADIRRPRSRRERSLVFVKGAGIFPHVYRSDR